MGLDPKAVGEAAYRLAINPTPSLRNLVMTDSQYSQLLPLMCRSAVNSHACPRSCTQLSQAASNLSMCVQSVGFMLAFVEVQK